jgi:hypothetical protein
VPALPVNRLPAYEDLCTARADGDNSVTFCG